LCALTSGHNWQMDGSAALLAPLVFLSGLHPAAVVRFSGPVFATLLAIAAGFCAFQYSRRKWTAYLASGLAAVLPIASGRVAAGEIARAEMGAVFALLAIALLRERRLAAGASAAVALLIDINLGRALLGPLACALAAIGSVRLLHLARYPVRALATGFSAAVFTFWLCSSLGARIPDGPYQYEAAAKACSQIARQFERNTWLVVSSGYELPFTYGRGWHVELLDFVDTPSFAYPARDIFFFVEREPLWPADVRGSRTAPARINLAQLSDRALWAYDSSLGRASVQFEAAAALAAYARTHADLRAFYQDEHLVIYWLH